MNPPESNLSEATTAGGENQENPPEFVYYVQTKPNPSAQPKKKSKISTFFSQFQSPIVKKTNAIADAEAEEAERTRIKKYRPIPSPGKSWALI